MGTSLQEDVQEYDRIIGAYCNKKAKNTAPGNIQYAGTHWPPENKNSMKYQDVRFMIREARLMLAKAYTVSKGAIDGTNQDAADYMTRWFGARNLAAGGNNRDWWKAACAIIGEIENFIVGGDKMYYRGDTLLIGKNSDHPNQQQTILTADDMDGYAQSETNDRDNIIGLCRLFFQKQNGRGTRKRTGSDSKAGTLVHELSHNICGTADHDRSDDSGTCYGTSGCLDQETHKASRAWYNADNIEYFCEDIYYRSPGRSR